MIAVGLPSPIGSPTPIPLVVSVLVTGECIPNCGALCRSCSYIQFHLRGVGLPITLADRWIVQRPHGHRGSGRSVCCVLPQVISVLNPFWVSPALFIGWAGFAQEIV